MKNILYLLFLTVTVSYSQDQASNWYFGENAGIQFNTLSGAVTALDNGQLNTREGCASISDEDGNLLFYTDGTTVYNSLHNVMSNGDNLLGDESSTQSAIVVPKPEDPNLYYIFTVDVGEEGLNFSIVDMTLDGGLGGITIKNNNLLDRCSEKITAVAKDCNSESVWVITLASLNGTTEEYNTFHAFEVSPIGVNRNAIESTFSTIFTDRRGYLKASPDGTMLASANVRAGLFIYNFNTTTGIVSNQQTLFTPNSSPYAYGVEFSPNNQYLYLHTFNDIQGGGLEAHYSSLVQYDLLSADINNSYIILDEQSLFRGALQLGPNGKIYRALSNSYTVGIPYLGVINNPNAAGTEANYQHLGVSLGNNNSTQGLPPFITSFFNQKIDIIQNGDDTNYLPLCDGDSYRLEAEDIIGATYTWYQDDALLVDSNYYLDVTQTGTYEVIIELISGSCDTFEGKAIVEFFENPTVTNVTLIQCDEDGVNDGLTIFNLEEANESLTGLNPDLQVVYYNNYNDALNELNPITNNTFSNTSNPQIIFAQVISLGAGCDTIAQVNLQISTTSSNNTSLISCDDDGTEDGIHEFTLNNADSDILDSLPAGLIVNYYANYNDALLEQNQLTTNFTNTIPYNQTIYGRVENANDCFGISEIELFVYASPEIKEDETTYYCINSFPAYKTLESGAINPESTYTFLWSTGETTSDIEINTVGTYTVTITNQYGCESTRNILVETTNIATIDSIEVVDALANNTIIVNASGEGEYEFALFNDNGPFIYYQTSNIFTNVDPGGIYTVKVREIKNNCGIVEDVISVIGFPKIFTPNNDGYNDYFQVYGVSQMFQPQTTVRIFDRYGKLLKEFSPLSPGWDGTFNGEVLPENDYWFTVKLQDGREHIHHFSLKQ